MTATLDASTFPVAASQPTAAAMSFTALGRSRPLSSWVKRWPYPVEPREFGRRLRCRASVGTGMPDRRAAGLVRSDHG